MTVVRKSENQNRHGQDPHKQIMAHVHALRMREIADYQAWCIANGFSHTLRKTSAQRAKELDTYRAMAVKERLKASDRERNIGRQLQNIIEKKAKRSSVTNEVLHEIASRLGRSRARRLLGEVFTYLEEKSDLLTDVRYVRGIASLVEHRNSWIRPLEAWTAKTHNAARQFASLARHLLARYDVPAFMDTVWFSADSTQHGWFVHIGQGGNIRTAHKLPLALTKKMAHWFMQAPDDVSAEGALRWAQVMALGGSGRLARAVMQTRLARRFKDNAFWETVLEFFSRNPMLDLVHVNPIVDYIWNEKYEDRMERLPGGQLRRLGPAQPNFTMRGRTPESLLRQVNEWHRRLGKETSAGDLRWHRAAVGEFRHEEGGINSGKWKVWTIRELLSSRELVAEGRQQQHCVATYAQSCFRRVTSIWTLELAEPTGFTKRATVELALPSKTIRQVRGRRNRLADSKERDVIQRWAQQEGLKGKDFL